MYRFRRFCEKNLKFRISAYNPAAHLCILRITCRALSSPLIYKEIFSRFLKGKRKRIGAVIAFSFILHISGLRFRELDVEIAEREKVLSPI